MELALEGRPTEIGRPTVVLLTSPVRTGADVEEARPPTALVVASLCALYALGGGA